MSVIDLCDSPPKSDLADSYDDNRKQNRDRLNGIACSNLYLHRGQGNAPSWQPFYLNSLRSEAVSPTVSVNNRDRCLLLNDIIASENEDILNVVILTYELDLEWLVTTVPLLTTLPLLILHGGSKKDNMIMLENVTMCPVDMGLERYGTHHNKIIIIFYQTGVRIAITTANFTEVDWVYKVQGTFVQDFRKKNCPSSSEFECGLINHCQRIIPMGKTAVEKWKDTIKQLQLYDYESAEVVLISSVPGRHTGSGRNKWGQWKLRDELQLARSDDTVENKKQKLLMQFSSIGSLKSGESFINELAISMSSNTVENTDNIDKSPSSTSKKRKATHISEVQGTESCVELVWPTVDSVRKSVQGWGAGFSLPCESKNMFVTADSHVVKSGLESRLHRYDTSCSGRGQFTPHMKCYLAYRMVENVGDKNSEKNNKKNNEGANDDEEEREKEEMNYKEIVRNKNEMRISDSDQVEVEVEEKNINSAEENLDRSRKIDGDCGILDGKQDIPELDWFLLTSSNLSQAAWGVSEKSGSQLYIKSFEIGVLFLPSRIRTVKRVFSCTPSHPILGYDCDDADRGSVISNNKNNDDNSNSNDDSDKNDHINNNNISTASTTSTRSAFGVSCSVPSYVRHQHDKNEIINVVHFPIPFKLPPDRYTIQENTGGLSGGSEKGILDRNQDQDRPWVWDRTYGDLRDRYGRTLCDYRTS